MLYTLGVPLEWWGKSWTEIVIRRPTPRELRRHWRPNTSEGAVNLLNAMIGIPKATLLEMDGGEFDAVCASGIGSQPTRLVSRLFAA